ncbi:MAG TPA: PilT/PilU family type 4a pilus ATPase [Thermoanaerobaculia bacterium]
MGTLTPAAGSTTLPPMIPASDDLLFGRIALHYKLVTREQLVEASQLQARRGGQRRLGEILVEQGQLTPQQVAQILAVQRDYVAKQQAQADAAAPPPAPALTAQPMPAIEVQTLPAIDAAPAPPPGPAFDLDAPRALDRLLAHALGAGASDLHVHSGAPLKLRVDGRMSDLEGGPVAARTAGRLVEEILTPEQRELLRERGQVDFAYTLPGQGRFRSNAYRQQRGTDAVFRVIPPHPPSLGDLGLPNSLARLANYHQGMVLLTGPAGCGKSSTLAALLNIINEERRDHIITIEDPIEYIHPSKRCVVNQRQVGPHTGSFARALRGALREDPDIIAIGELRDLETISLALTAAETGHLVLATLHTNNAIRTVNRILGVFPPNQQDQIRTMVSESLRAVVSQRLAVRADGNGRVPALEILMANKAVGNLIRENKTFQIKSVLQTGASHGMCQLDASLAELVKSRVITREEAMRHSDEPQRFASA